MKREPSRETLSRPGKPRWPAARSGPRQPTVAAASAAIACLIFVTVRRQLDCAQPEKRADPAAGTPWPLPHPARSAVLPGLTWSNRGLAHRKADTTEQPDLKRPRTQPGAGRRRTDRRISRDGRGQRSLRSVSGVPGREQTERRLFALVLRPRFESRRTQIGQLWRARVSERPSSIRPRPGLRAEGLVERHDVVLEGDDRGLGAVGEAELGQDA